VIRPAANRPIKRGLYLAYWPNRTFTVAYFCRQATLADLFSELDSFGDPFSAKVVQLSPGSQLCHSFAIDFDFCEVDGRQRVKKEFSDRPVARRVKFPADMLQQIYGAAESCGHGS
jgi:hypothetical protein